MACPIRASPEAWTVCAGHLPRLGKGLCWARGKEIQRTSVYMFDLFLPVSNSWANVWLMPIEKEAEAPQVQESDSDSEKKFRLVDAQWLRAQRSAVNGEVELKVFQDKLTDAATSFQNSQGHGVGVAIAMTLGAIVLGVLGVSLGIFIMVLAGDWISSMAEG